MSSRPVTSTQHSKFQDYIERMCLKEERKEGIKRKETLKIRTGLGLERWLRG